MVSRNCDGILVSPMREEEPRDTTVMVSLAIVIGASVVFIVLLLAVVSLAFYRWDLDTIQLELSTKFIKVSQYLEKAHAKASPSAFTLWIIWRHYAEQWLLKSEPLSAKLIIDRSLDLCRTKSPVSDTLV